MLGLKENSMKEKFWPAVAGALGMHVFVIAAVAITLGGQNGASPQDFHAQMIFQSHSETRKSKVFTSLLVGEDADELCEEAGEGNTFMGTKPQERYLPVATPPSPATLPCVRVDLPHKGRGKQQPVLTRSSPTISSGGVQPSVGTQDAFPLFNPPPLYPREARLRKIEGVVMVQIHVSERGAVSEAKTLPPHRDPILEDARGAD
jgi:hypothetical protein